MIALVKLGVSTRKAAAACGVSPSTVDRWVSQSRAGKPHGANGRPRHPGREKFHQLREEGRSVRAAAAVVGVSSMSGYKWDTEMRAGGACQIK
ncbi:helix-turn-helix domain-containing protein [Nesterenkonia salmonea]|uniref:Helix-turn-helix domain-containing protein n=1 Tax=Nesterenkonia salmonea TaxID=1804987 RepID=A0A5R9B6U5_9MICC|nr:helix-turn-helix domain-containing protein [Nesterenkonia salmonea]